MGGLALAAGVAAAVTDTAALGLGAGVGGAVAGCVAAAASQRAGSRPEQAQQVPEERDPVEAEAPVDRSMAQVLAEPAPTPDQLLTDADTGLPGRAYFAVSLDGRVDAARRNLRPMSVVVLEVADHLGLPIDPVFVAKALRDTLRAADIACRLEGHARFALILEDTAEQGALGTIERVRQAMIARGPAGQILWAGIATYPNHALGTEDLRRRAVEALDVAKETRRNHVEIAAVTQ